MQSVVLFDPKSIVTSICVFTKKWIKSTSLRFIPDLDPIISPKSNCAGELLVKDVASLQRTQLFKHHFHAMRSLIPLLTSSGGLHELSLAMQFLRVSDSTQPMQNLFSLVPRSDQIIAHLYCRITSSWLRKKFC